MAFLPVGRSLMQQLCWKLRVLLKTVFTLTQFGRTSFASNGTHRCSDQMGHEGSGMMEVLMEP